ncbi:hypothetical protein DSM05_02580 [Pseudomonas sp. FW305-3-2-15-E-TSA4]|nr:hypothetical protein [Pseudomonas sp. FW305-3-2-15-E-TSA4]
MPDAVDIGSTPGRAWRYDPAAELAEADPPAPVFIEPLDDVRARTAKRLGRVARCRDLSAPVPPIRKLLQADDKLRAKQREVSWMASWYEPRFVSGFEQRRLRLLNAIGGGLAKIGGRLEVCDKAGRDLRAVIGEQNLTFTLDHPGARPNRHGEHEPRKDASGPLRLELKPRWPAEGANGAWNDGDARKLEDQLTEIVLAMVVAGEAEFRSSCVSWHEYLLKRRRENEIEVARRRVEAEQRERERLAEEAKARRERLFAQGAAWRSAQDIRSMVAALPEDGHGPELREWKRWALAEADALDPVCNGELLAPWSWGDGSAAGSGSLEAKSDQAIAAE